MPLKKRKNFSEVWPKTGKPLGHKKRHYWLIWLLPLTGLLALIWFLIRVIPKPSRAIYPCQRVAMPLASGFVVWLTGLIGSTLIYRKARCLFRQSRYILAGACAAVAVMVIWTAISITSDNPAEAFTPTEPLNSPMGVAKGIYPGRVVWLHDPDATSWDGSTGDWWDENNTNQSVVDYMLSKTICSLTGQVNDANAWDVLFRHFNQQKGKENVGYQAPEKIIIKINENNQHNSFASTKAIDASPQVVRGLLHLLVNEADVAQSAIIVYDAQRPISNPVYDYCRAQFPDVEYKGGAGYPPTLGPNFVWVSDVMQYSDEEITNANAKKVPQCIIDAEYMINMALLKAHPTASITLCAKNHFGTVGYCPVLHSYVRCNSRGMSIYNPLVDLMGSENTGKKTLLYMIDGLYGAPGAAVDPIQWNSEPFNTDWPSSIFVSQDPVAIDSVGLDFLRNEWTLQDYTDNYLHEAAEANNPPSGTFYDPDHPIGDTNATRLPSLGVHEHWNNPTDKQYTRNLETGNGIELVRPPITGTDGPVENLTTAKKYDYIRLAINDANSDDLIVVSPGTYHENIDFKGKNLTVRSTDPFDPVIVAATVIDGNNQNAEPTVTFSTGEDANSVLDGFTITNGNTKYGGGIYCSASSPIIKNCYITTNSASNQGGGIYCKSSSPTLVNCTINANSASIYGGGMFNYNNSSPVIINCTFSANSALAYGGAICNHSNCDPELTNCTLRKNSVTLNGGAIGNLVNSSPTLTNCILWDNIAPTDPQIFDLDPSFSTVTYSNVQGGLSGTGNINADPCFVDPNGPDNVAGTDDDNLRLATASACIDAGNNSAVPADLADLDNDANATEPTPLDPDKFPRFIDDLCTTDTGSGTVPIVDMGAYEFLRSDIDSNGDVDFKDFAAFALYWLQTGCGTCAGAELTCDGNVNVYDLAELVESWLMGI